MDILVLNGSPRPNGNTAAMVEVLGERTCPENDDYKEVIS